MSDVCLTLKMLNFQANIESKFWFVSGKFEQGSTYLILKIKLYLCVHSCFTELGQKPTLMSQFSSPPCWHQGSNSWQSWKQAPWFAEPLWPLFLLLKNKYIGGGRYKKHQQGLVRWFLKKRRCGQAPLAPGTHMVEEEN